MSGIHDTTPPELGHVPIDMEEVLRVVAQDKFKQYQVEFSSGGSIYRAAVQASSATAAVMKARAGLHEKFEGFSRYSAVVTAIIEGGPV
jgi:spore germination cell wall hydrolase CwlJ-like protein